MHGEQSSPVPMRGKEQDRKLQLGCSDMSQGAVLPVVVNVANTGSMAGDDIVMAFVSFPNTQAERRSVKELKGLPAGPSRRWPGEANHNSHPPAGPRLLRDGFPYGDHGQVGRGEWRGRNHGRGKLREPTAGGTRDGRGILARPALPGPGLRLDGRVRRAETDGAATPDAKAS